MNYTKAQIIEELGKLEQFASECELDQQNLLLSIAWIGHKLDSDSYFFEDVCNDFDL